MAFEGSIFNRTISTITVKWLAQEMKTKWAPFVKCPIIRKWMEKRRKAGMSELQSMAAFVHAYLDDFWIVGASTCEEDIDRLREICLEAFKYLGWTLSMSKFDEEGSMNPVGVLIGHHVDCKMPATRGIMEIKQLRIRHSFEPMLGEEMVSKQEILETIGLCESVRGDTAARWRHGPIYRMAHSTPPNAKRPDLVLTTKSAKRCILKILQSLHLRRSLFHRATRWNLPTAPTVNMVPNADAAQQTGYAGVLLDGRVLFYFQGLWSEELKSKRVNIAVLEAWAVVMTAATWGSRFNYQKVVFRTDTGASCACLNRLWSGSKPALR
jgi:hypothetical protein